MFAKCIRQNFLISILPSDLLICLEGKTPTDQHSESAFYPHWSANQQVSIFPLPKKIIAELFAIKPKAPDQKLSLVHTFNRQQLLIPSSAIIMHD